MSTPAYPLCSSGQSHLSSEKKDPYFQAPRQKCQRKPPEWCWVLWLPGQRPRSRNYNLSKIPALSVAKETGRLAPSASLSEHKIQTRQRKGREERIGGGEADTVSGFAIGYLVFSCMSSLKRDGRERILGFLLGSPFAFTPAYYVTVVLSKGWESLPEAGI